MNHKTLFLVRKGNLGDVILTEPIARALKTAGRSVVLVTKFSHAETILPTYDDVKPFSFYLQSKKQTDEGPFVFLMYERYPELHYIDAYAKCAGVSNFDRQPHIQGGTNPIITDEYCLIAPHTSNWCRKMREWDYRKFENLARKIESEFGIRTIMLKQEHSFEEMLSFIEHCRLFIGNDSGPGIIAQAYNRPALIIFGSTDPTKVLFSPLASGILCNVGCNGCKQRDRKRKRKVKCRAVWCLDFIKPVHILKEIQSKLNG